MSLFHEKMGLAGLLFLTITILAVSPSQGGTITENFDNNQFNQTLWFGYEIGPGSTGSITDNSAVATLPPSGGATLYQVGLGSKFTLVGDFDMQVDFDLLSWPANNEAQVGLTINQANDFSINRRSPGSGGEIYFTMIKGQMTEVPASGTPGKLRMTRTGNMMQGFYWGGAVAGWVRVGFGTDPSLGLATSVNINLNRDTSMSGPIVGAAFDNILIHTPDSPALLLLLND